MNKQTQTTQSRGGWLWVSAGVCFQRLRQLLHNGFSLFDSALDTPKFPLLIVA